MKKSPHRSSLFMRSCCSCSFSPCRRLHILQAGSKWIELVCGKVPIRWASQCAHLQSPSQSATDNWTRRLDATAWLTHCKLCDHDYQNGLTLPFLTSHSSREDPCVLPLLESPLSAFALCAFSPQSIFLPSFVLFLSHHSLLLLFLKCPCSEYLRGKPANTLRILMKKYNGGMGWLFWLQ